MTEQEIRAVLAVAMAYDNRKPGDASVAAWLEAAQRGRWAFDDAVEAVHAHFAESTEWLMPAHVTQRLRAARSGPAAVAELLALPAAAPSAPERVRSIVDAVAGRLGWVRAVADPAALGVLDQACPHCHSGPGRPCTREIARGRRRGELVALAAPHPSRSQGRPAAPASAGPEWTP
jgi:hypothetical protein